MSCHILRISEKFKPPLSPLSQKKKQKPAKSIKQTLIKPLKEPFLLAQLFLSMEIKLNMSIDMTDTHPTLHPSHSKGI